MGVITYVVCTACEVKRDLDKFYSLGSLKLINQDNGKSLQKVVENDSFRYALLGEFMYQHEHHCCSLVTDNSEQYDSIEHYKEEDYFERN